MKPLFLLTTSGYRCLLETTPESWYSTSSNTNCLSIADGVVLCLQVGGFVVTLVSHEVLQCFASSEVDAHVKTKP